MSTLAKIFFILLIAQLFPQLFTALLWGTGTLLFGLILDHLIRHTELGKRTIIAGEALDYLMLDLKTRKITLSLRPWYFSNKKRKQALSKCRFEIAIQKRYLTTRW